MTRSIPNPSRRAVLAASAIAASLPAVSQAKQKSAPSAPDRFWYKQPAARWEEALPIGNGRLGAMVFGRVAQERLQLNEDTLSSGAPYTPDNPEALAALPEVRRLINAGQFKAASDLAGEKMMAKPLWQMSYGTLGDLLLDFDDPHVPSRYERTLDLSTAITTTTFRTPAGAFRREVFSSAPDQVIVLQLEAPKGKLGFALKWRGPRKADYISPDYHGSATTLIQAEATNWLQVEPDSTNDPKFKSVADGNGYVLMTGRNEAGPMTADGLSFAMRAKVITDGKVSNEGGRLQVSGATTATLLLAAATSYINFRDVSGDPVTKVRQQTESAAAKPYATLRAKHIRAHQALYKGVTLDLGRTSAAAKPTDNRVSAVSADDPALAALYFAYARYLMISSSRPGGQPANLQGLWNEGINPPWGCKYTININTEMNYWVAGPASLGACVEPLLRLVEDLSVTGAKTAQTMYGARGWMAHHNTDLWRAAAPIDGPLWGLWQCGGAWLCNSLWDHYDYSRDPEVLKRIYPLLAGASLFFLDFLVEDPKGRGLETSPSLSPENVHPFGVALCAGPAMDRQIIRDLFDNTVKAGKLLDTDGAFLAQVAATRARIAPDKIGKNGQLQEWLEDWDADAPDQHHRHVSHLYAVYPSGQINVRDTPDFIEAAKVSLKTRGDLATGWGTAWRLCLWARMGEGDHAHEVMKALLGPERTYPNLFDAHPPFQIDGNFGGAAGIMEMIVQSWGEEVRLLPALPMAWPSGEAKGVGIRGGMTVDVAWSSGKLTKITVKGPAWTKVRLRYLNKPNDVTLNAQGLYSQRL